MCGRFSQHWEIVNWDNAWPSDWRAPEFQPRYNVSPGSRILSLIHGYQDEVIAGLMTWGIKTPRAFLINARAESLESRPTFRPLLSRRRCVIPMNGYYEWHHLTRQPYYITRPGKSPGWALGLYQQTAGGPTAVILTRSASSALADIHPRMPVLAERDEAEAWLRREPAQYRDVLNMLLAQDPQFEMQPVSRRVNKSSEEGPDLIMPWAPDSEAT